MTRAMAAIDYDYLIRDRDRHGNARWYVRKKDCRRYGWGRAGHGRVRSRISRGAGASSEAPAPDRPVMHERTWRWLVDQYLRSADHKALHPSTQKQRLRVLQRRGRAAQTRRTRNDGRHAIVAHGRAVIASCETAKLGYPKRPTSGSKPSGAYSPGQRLRPCNVNPSRDVRRVATARKATTYGLKSRSNGSRSAIRSARARTSH